MKNIRKTISFFLLLLFPVLAISAQVQSFYISPQQTIRNGDLVRGYCLEYTRDVLSNDNIEDLKEITGNVLVTFKNNTTQEMSFGALVQQRLIRITGYNSAQYISISLDDGIDQITVINNGIILARENMSPDETSLINANVQEIRKLEQNGEAHQYIQDTVWKNKKPQRVDNAVTRETTITFHPEPGKELFSFFDNTASIVFDNNNLELRFDSLIRENDNAGKTAYDFITHWHNDHIDSRHLEQLLEQGLDNPVFFPLPVLDSSMRSRAFELLNNSIIDNTYQYSIQNYICEVSPFARFLNNPKIKCGIGDFIYTEYEFNDLKVGTFRYINPKTTNMDGLIYKVTYKNVSYLLFGDFDDPAALDNLFSHSQENLQRKLALLDEYYALEGQLYARDSAEIRQRRAEISWEMQFLPTIQADVVKWPHHATLFEEKDRNFIHELNTVVNPHYIIYQFHPAQERNRTEFEALINNSGFKEKFIDSARYRVRIISLLEQLNTGRPS